MSDQNKEMDELDRLLLGDDFLPDIEVKEKIIATSPLANKFLEIVDFYETYKRLPGSIEKPSIKEKSLARTLNSIRKNPDYFEEIKPLDKHDLLNPNKVSEEIVITEEDVLNDIFGLLNDDDVYDDLFNDKYNRKVVNKPDEIARPYPCLNYDIYKQGFEQVNADLENGKLKFIRYNYKLEIEVGDYFLYKGLIGTIVSKEEKFVDKAGKENYRCKIVYNNQTEINMLYLSLGHVLFRDKGGSKIVSSDINVKEYKLNGYVYVLSTLSKSPELSEYKDNLYKVGVTKGTVDSRIANAEKSTTYLEAPVTVVAEAACRGRIDPEKLEKSIQYMLASRRLNVTLVDSNGKKYKPKEWFVVPFETIRDIIKYINDGTISCYIVNSVDGKLIKK